MIRLLPIAGLLAALVPAAAQDFGTNPVPSPKSDTRAAANAALQAHDFPKALALLQPLAAANPKDAQVLYDLGSAQDALDQATAAEQSYRAAIADDPKLLEPHVALGLMLAREGHLPEARTELAAATKIETPDSPVTNPLKARAYRALARIDQKARPGEARDELLEALKRSPESSEDTMLAAELAQAASNGAPAAEAEYRRLLAEHPGDPEATAALAHLLTADKRAPEAESLLEAGLAAHPDDPTLTAQLAALYTSESKTEKALPLVQKLQKNNPQNTDIADMLASLYLKAGDYAQAEPILAELSSRRPQDTTLVMDRADALIRMKRYADAQRILTRIVAEPRLFQKPEDLASAAGALAFAASENNDPQGSLQAITVRGTVFSPSATILFLAAIAHDKLNQVKLAEQAYEQFLAAANGTLPDQEFEAKHRLVALEHRK